MFKMAEKTKKVNVIKNRTVKFFKELRSELKKVVWLNMNQLKNNTVTVLLACLLVGSIIWIADILLDELVKLTLVR
jgi:preprotein translocase subunit SecE